MYRRGGRSASRGRHPIPGRGRSLPRDRGTASRGRGRGASRGTGDAGPSRAPSRGNQQHVRISTSRGRRQSSAPSRMEGILTNILDRLETLERPAPPSPQNNQDAGSHRANPPSKPTTAGEARAVEAMWAIPVVDPRTLTSRLSYRIPTSMYNYNIIQRIGR